MQSETASSQNEVSLCSGSRTRTFAKEQALSFPPSARPSPKNRLTQEPPNLFPLPFREGKPNL